MARPSGVLVLCYGNPGRLDDGLGPAFAEAMERMALPGVTVESDYQLTVEDAPEIAKHEVVVFVDASVNAPEPFEFRPLKGRPVMRFSTHSVEPEDLLGLTEQYFNARPEGYALAIRGYEWNEFGEALSEKAQENLASALQFLAGVIQTRNFRDIAARGQNKPPASPGANNGDIPCKTENM